MTRNDFGFWLLVIGIGGLLFRRAYQAYTTSTIVTTDQVENTDRLLLVSAGVGMGLLWRKIQ